MWSERSRLRWRAAISLSTRSSGALMSASQVSEQLVQFVVALAQAAFAARTAAEALPPDAAEGLAQLAKAPPPLDRIATLLRTVADPNQPPPTVPDALPEPLAKVLEALVEAVK